MRTSIGSRGVTLVEVVFGATIAAVVLAFVSHAILLFVTSSEVALRQTQALFLAEAGHELVRYMRDEDWNTINNLTAGTTYHLNVATNTVSITTSPEVIDGTFTRSVVLNELRRDASHDVTQSGGTIDPEGREITVTVSAGSKSISLSSILVNINDI